MSFRIVIPARYAATRLPAKLLRTLAGKPIIQHVHQQALKAGAGTVIVATDDARIKEVCESFGAEVCMTSPDHSNATERLAEVAEKYQWADGEIVVNLQGDEPLMPPSCLQQVADLLGQHTECDMATLCVAIEEEKELFDPNVVKVVRDKANLAIYFSRAPIPWDRDRFPQAKAHLNADQKIFLRHIGLYAYKTAFLKEYSTLQISPLEETESLEQLRALWHRKLIAVGEADEIPPPGIDTEADLARAEEYFSRH